VIASSTYPLDMMAARDSPLSPMPRKECTKLGVTQIHTHRFSLPSRSIPASHQPHRSRLSCARPSPGPSTASGPPH